LRYEIAHLHGCEFSVACAELRVQRDELGVICRGGISGDDRQR
jgi:hypothetical protein